MDSYRETLRCKQSHLEFVLANFPLLLFIAVRYWSIFGASGSISRHLLLDDDAFRLGIDKHHYCEEMEWG